MGNDNLHAALKNKNDEFYTLYEDVEKELNNYSLFFKDKIIFLPCDTEESSFWRYFINNFTKFQLERLVALHLEEPNSYCLTYEGGGLAYTKNFVGNNGDFFGELGQSILEECDIVITNPPFSRYREFVSSIVAAEKDFILIGNENSITAQDVFPLFQNNQIHYGYNNVKAFEKPDGTIQQFGNICWFSNLPVERKDKIIPTGELKDFPQYDNYEAINIDKVKDIPAHCDEVMGVPITYLKKHNPDKYKILGLASGAAKRHKLYGSVPYTPNPNDKGGAAMVDGKVKYTRIFIKEK